MPNDKKRLTKQLIFSLNEQEQSALTALALDEGTSCADVMRQLLRQEARKRGLLPPPPPSLQPFGRIYGGKK